ncbi:MAG: helix-turn-helix domain-containing protein [Paraclostridium sp.]
MLTVAEVKKLLKQGLTDAEIAECFGCSRHTVFRFRQSNGIPNSVKWKSEEKKKSINKLRNKCKNQTELGEKVGLSQRRVSTIISNNEIDYSKKQDRLRIRKFGTWTIIKRLNEESYKCICDCGFEKIFSQLEIKTYSNICPECRLRKSFTIRQKMFLADYKRAEKVRQKDLKKRGKSYTINSVKKVDEIGRDTYVNLICPAGHSTKNKFNRYDGCRVFK